jgi:hypothetical protein
MTTRHDPAFPRVLAHSNYTGLTKLEYAAIQILSGTDCSVHGAVMYANELFDVLEAK